MTPDFDLGGYAEVRGSYQFGVDGTPWNLTERVRPRFEIAPQDRITAEAVVEASFTEGRVPTDEAAAIISASDVGDLLETAGCSYTPEPRYASPSDYLSVERLHVDFNLPAVDLTIGRQPLNWGSSLIFHPTDLVNDIVATDPGKEKRGIDAIKAEVPIKGQQLTAVVALDDDLSPLFDEDDRQLPIEGAAKMTFHAFGADLSAVGHAKWDGSWFAGTDLRGTNGVGWWLEGGYHGGVDEPGVEAIVGIDYSFLVLNTLYVAAEYRYDQTGDPPLGDPVDGVSPGFYDLTERAGTVTIPYDCAFVTAPEPGTRTTLGIHYADAVVRLGVTEDVTVSAVGLMNLLDHTGMIVPDVAVNVGDRVSLHASGQILYGKRGEFRPSAEDLTYDVGGASVDLSGLVPTATALVWARTSF